MSKKKEVEQATPVSEKKNPGLSPAQYWEWRTTVTELHLAQRDFEKSQIELKLLQKEAEVCAIRSQLFQCNRMEATKLGVTSAQKEYERYTKVLEDFLGLSLKNKIIDDITYEIRDVPDQKIKAP